MIILCWTSVDGIRASRVISKEALDGVLAWLVSRGASGIHTVPR